MPIVPTTPGPRVATRGIPGVRVRGTAPAEAFAPLPDLSGVTQEVARLHAQAMQDADQIAVNGAEVQAADLRGQIHTQITSAQGTNALGALDTARQAWDDGVAKIADGLNERQQQFFRARAAMHWVDLKNTAEAHAATEMRAADKESTYGMVDKERGIAIDNATNPALLGDALERMRARLADYGRREGWTPEITAQETARQISKAHVEVIESLVDSGQDLSAKAYIAAHGTEIEADQRHRVATLGRASSIKGEGQRIADQITSNADLSLTEALAKVPTDTDPDVREHAESRIRRAYYDRAAEDRQSNAQAFQQASDILEKTGDLDNIPLTLRSQLRASQNSSLEHRAKQLQVEQGDDANYFKLKQMASLSPATRAAFLKENLLAYPKLSHSQRDELLNLQLRFSTYNEHHGEPTTPDATPAPPAPSPVPPAPKNPLDGLLTPSAETQKKKPTAAMIHDVQAFGEEYAKYLREHGYDVPPNAHIVGASPAATPKK